MSEVGLLNTTRYFPLFSIKRKEDIIDSEYVWAAPDKEILSFGALNWNEKEDDDTGLVDTPLEFALLSYYSPAVVQIRPVEAATILPAGNQRLSGLKLGAAVYQELQILRFIDKNNTGAIGRYETMIKFIQDKHCLTRAEIEKYYRDGIRGLITEVVNEEFNKISFLLRINQQTSYNCILTRNANNQYVLNYESYFGTDTKSTKELSGTSLEALSSAMSRSEDFSATASAEIRAQAALIPAVALPSEMNRVINAITAFYTSPSESTFEEFNRIYRGYRIQNLQERAARDSFMDALYSLNTGLTSRIRIN